MVSTSSQTSGTATTTSAWPKPSRATISALRLPVGEVLAHQVLAGDAEIDAALAEFAGDLGGRQERHLDIVAALDAGAVFAVVAGQADGKAGARQHVERLLLQPALRRDGEGDGHRAAPRSASMRSSQTEKPTPGIGVLRAEQRQQPVVAAAAGQRPRRHRRPAISKTRPV